MTMPRALAFGLLLLLPMSAPRAWAAEPAPAPVRVAKIQLNELHDDLFELVLNKPENAALKKSKELNDANDLKRNAISQGGDKDGKTVEELLHTVPDNDYQAMEKLERLVRAEVLRIVTKKYGNRFSVILDGDNNQSLIYLDGEMIDLTQTLKQSLQLNEF
jgi:hypothetical protein